MESSWIMGRYRWLGSERWDLVGRGCSYFDPTMRTVNKTEPMKPNGFRLFIAPGAVGRLPGFHWVPWSLSAINDISAEWM